jgi:hypothetical protein
MTVDAIQEQQKIQINRLLTALGSRTWLGLRLIAVDEFRITEKPQCASSAQTSLVKWPSRMFADIHLTVRNYTASLPLRCQDQYVPQNKSKIKSGRAILASVKREMAEPRMARSARIEQLKLEKAQTREQPSTTMPGTVDKIILSPRPSQPEEAQIAVARANQPHRDFRIENMLTGEHGDDVKLKKGAHVEVTVTAKDIKP